MAFTEAIGSGDPLSTTHEKDDIEKAGNLEQNGGPSTPPQAEIVQTSNWKKPYEFYLASLSLWLAVLIVSLDSTGLAVAVPVRPIPNRIVFKRKH